MDAAAILHHCPYHFAALRRRVVPSWAMVLGRPPLWNNSAVVFLLGCCSSVRSIAGRGHPDRLHCPGRGADFGFAICCLTWLAAGSAGLPNAILRHPAPAGGDPPKASFLPYGVPERNQVPHATCGQKPRDAPEKQPYRFG